MKNVIKKIEMFNKNHDKETQNHLIPKIHFYSKKKITYFAFIFKLFFSEKLNFSG